ncbi:hypothetical protein PGB90_003952 [Kerria lacca]
MVTSNRKCSNTVEKTNEKAKDEARKALYEVTSVIGRQEYSISYHDPKYDEEYIKRFVDFFNRKHIDSWEIRRAIHDLVDHDSIPDPEIVCACLRACRRLNDYALAIRVLEVTKNKCGNKVKEYYPYILQEIKPTLDELGLETIEELGYDKPELAVVDVDDIH